LAILVTLFGNSVRQAVCLAGRVKAESMIWYSKSFGNWNLFWQILFPMAIRQCLQFSLILWFGNLVWQSSLAIRLVSQIGNSVWQFCLVFWFGNPVWQFSLAIQVVITFGILVWQSSLAFQFGISVWQFCLVTQFRNSVW
jgi:hypothetical protein